jgi:uncharacterized protein YhfF
MMRAAVDTRVAAFWSAFLARTARSPATALYESFAFGDSEGLATALAGLVRRGEKVATASGDLSVVTAWDGRPLCVIETTAVEIRAFEDVDAEFAAAEGEGDRSLGFWREAHWNYFGRVCGRLGRTPSPQMPVVCERFRVVFDPRDGG